MQIDYQHQSWEFIPRGELAPGELLALASLKCDQTAVTVPDLQVTAICLHSFLPGDALSPVPSACPLPILAVYTQLAVLLLQVSPS